MKNNKTLLIGPWVGEFGWELFTWQGLARHISKEYSKVIVAGKKGNEFLYEDFCDEYVTIKLPDGVFSDSWFCRDKQMNVIPTDFIESMIKDIKFDDRLDPNKICSGMFLMTSTGVARTSELFYSQEFIKYKSNSLDKSYDILIHPRNKGVGDTRNWNQKKWQELVNLLSKKNTVGIIGTHEAFKLEGADDCRNISISDTVSLMNRTKLIVGQSSGPLHLGSLCGTPHLVWSTEHNRKRYFEYWNPFKTPIYFYPEMEWNPSVEFIYDKIIKNLK